MSIDVDSIIQGVLFGEAVRATSPSIATSWAFNPIRARAVRPGRCEANAGGRRVTDENGDGVLEAHGAMYAPDDTGIDTEIAMGFRSEKTN